MLVLGTVVLLTFTFGVSTLAQPQPLALTPADHVFQSPSSVVSSFDSDLNNHDSAAALALFADGSMVSDTSNIACLPGPPPFCRGYNVFSTQTQIRGWLEQLVKENVQLKETQPLQVVGNNVTWVVEISLDEYRRLGVAPLEADANAVVQEGKISSLTIALTSESTNRLSLAYAQNRASPYAIMASGIGFGMIFLGFVFPAAAVYYISRVKRLFATVPRLDKPWILLGAAVGALFISVLLEALRDIAGMSTSVVDIVFGVTVVVCSFVVMLAMVLMKRVMIGEADE